MNQETVETLTGWVPLVLPEALLLLTACVLFLGATVRSNRNLWAVVALSGLAVAAVAAWFGPRPVLPIPEAVLYASPVLIDSMALLIKGVALAGGALLVLMSWHEIPQRVAGEYFACLLVIVAGTSLTASANELITLFLALEMISIPTYVLLYLPRQDPKAQEAAMKYFLLSIFSSALLLFGFSYLYGLTGTTNLPASTQALASVGPGGLPAVGLMALVLVVAGLGFRITAVPFHFYAPDVYQGTSTPAAALLAFVPKVAGFVALVRVLGFAPQAQELTYLGVLSRVYPGLTLGPQVSTLFWILAAATMTLGNVLALLQDNLKRLLAYSSVAHAGYMLIGLAVAPYLRAEEFRPSGLPVPVGGVEAVLFYVTAYGAMTLGAFAVITSLHTPQRPVETVDDLAGLYRSHPGMALGMGVFLLSMIGIPLTAGFAGKLFLFLGAMGVNPAPEDVAALEVARDQARLFRILALVGALNAAIGGWYYLRLLVAMFLRNPLRPVEQRTSGPILAAVGLCAFLTLYLGINPEALLRPAQQAVATHRPGERGALAP